MKIHLLNFNAFKIFLVNLAGYVVKVFEHVRKIEHFWGA